MFKDIVLKNNLDQDFSLNMLKGKKIVLYFYPKDNTQGCTNEGIGFNELLDEFKALNTEIIGVSRDSVQSHKKFVEKNNFKFLLLSDTDEKMHNEFKVIGEKNNYEKKVIGVIRSTFILDENGQVVKEFRNVKAKGHAERILDFIKSSEKQDDRINLQRVF